MSVLAHRVHNVDGDFKLMKRDERKRRLIWIGISGFIKE
jgi:hypothetical protein